MSRKSQTNAMPLTMLRPGESAHVSHIAGSHGASRKLTAMGIAPGVEVSILNTQSGPLLVRVGGARVALGRGMAHRVMVSAAS